MSNHDEQDLLTRTLRERAAGVGGGPLDLETVRGRARGIKRRRNALRGAVAALVAALAVPGGLAVNTALQTPGEDSPGGVATQAPSGTGSPVPRPDGPVELTLQGLPRGDAPALPYVVAAERVLVTSGVSRNVAEAYAMMLPYADGWVALTGSRRGLEVVMLDAELRETSRTLSGGESIVASQDGSQVAWAVRKAPGQVTLHNAPVDGGDPMSWSIDVPEDAMFRPVGFLDRDTIVYDTGGMENEVALATAGGERTHLAGFLDVSDASEANGLVAGRTSYDDIDGPGSCSGVKQPEAPGMLWERCGVTIGKFSPDGRYVTAYPGQFDYAAPSLLVLDARTGDTLVEFSPEKGQRTIVGVQQVAWEDAGSLLAVVVEGNEQALVRARLDGSLELLTPIREQNMDMQYWVVTEDRR